jgi:hypothetical protein
MINKTGLKMIREMSEGRGKEAGMKITILYQITPGSKVQHLIQFSSRSQVQLKV